MREGLKKGAERRIEERREHERRREERRGEDRRVDGDVCFEFIFV